MATHKFTPNNIAELQPDEVFVFGSNKAGNHAGGAARIAVEKFGAIMGQAGGMQGQSYAIPTLDEQMQKVSIEELERSVRDFADCTLQNINKTFYVTKIGCGIAGFAVEEIAEVFKHVAFGSNVILPREFGEEKDIAGYKGFDPDMTCRGFQFKEGEMFEEDVEPEVCERGFHFCESPFSVLNYRNLLDDDCKFTPIHEVTGLGKSVTDSDKIATTKIRIGARLDLPGFIKAGIDFLYDKCIKYAPKSNISSGFRAQIGSSGDGAQIGSSGDGAQIGSSGDGAQIESFGNNAVVAAIGAESIVKAKKGSWITLAEYDDDGNPRCVKSAQIDGKDLKADVFYQLKDGEFVEVEE